VGEAARAVTDGIYRVPAEAAWPPPPVALRTEGLCKRWGAVYVNDRIDLTLPVGARHALIGPTVPARPRWVNLLDRPCTPPTARAGCCSAPPTSRGWRCTSGSSAVWCARSRINTAVPRAHRDESVVLAICERNGAARRWARSVARFDAPIAEAAAPARPARPGLGGAHGHR